METAPTQMPRRAFEFSERIESVDILRGTTIAAMLLVNNPGSWSYIYDPLEHAAWNGWAVTDLIFPSSIWSASR